MATADWTANQVKARVIEQGLTLKHISVSAGLSPDAASVALRRRWRAAEQAVADALGIAPETIWPSRYSAKGQEATCPGRFFKTPRRARTAGRAAKQFGHDR